MIGKILRDRVLYPHRLLASNLLKNALSIILFLKYKTGAQVFITNDFNCISPRAEYIRFQFLYIFILFELRIHVKMVIRIKPIYFELTLEFFFPCSVKALCELSRGLAASKTLYDGQTRFAIDSMHNALITNVA